jgi:hypothetical protein
MRFNFSASCPVRKILSMEAQAKALGPGLKISPAGEHLRQRDGDGPKCALHFDAPSLAERSGPH